MEGWLDRLDASGRWALIKLTTGGLRIGVSARLAKQAVADLADKPVNDIEEVWHGLKPPYTDLFAWLEGRGGVPQSTVTAPFRPVMLAQAIADDDLKLIAPETHAAEWKWDGIRVQAVNEGGVKRLYTRTGDDISHTFPDIVAGLDVEAALDGELLVGHPDAEGFVVRSFSDLQQRLNRKTVTAKLLASHPAYLRVYDCLVDGSEDIRALPFRNRRKRLEALVAGSLSGRMDLSPLLTYANVEELAALRAAPPEAVIEGVMLKRWELGLRARAAEGAVVQVEARPAHGGCGADVCPARPRQALVLLFRLHIRGLARGRGGRGTGAGGQGLFRLHR